MQMIKPELSTWYAGQLLSTNSYEGPYVKDPLSFMEMIRLVRAYSDRFSLIEPKSTCSRDRKVDRDRKKLTCTNHHCKDCKFY